MKDIVIIGASLPVTANVIGYNHLVIQPVYDQTDDRCYLSVRNGSIGFVGSREAVGV